MSATTIPLKAILRNAEITPEYEIVRYKGVSFGLLPVLPESDELIAQVFASFPIHDEEYRPVLVGKILDRYWNREIGQESVDMFLHSLRRWLNEEMPLFSQLYQGITLDQAFETVNITTKTKGENTAETDQDTNSESKSNTKSGAKTFNNEMPQSPMDADEYYATNAAESKSETDTTGEGKEKALVKQKGDSTGESTTTGYQGNAASLLAAFRDSLLNVDTLILDRMAPLFMLYWRTGDARDTTEYLRGLL